MMANALGGSPSTTSYTDTTLYIYLVTLHTKYTGWRHQNGTRRRGSSSTTSYTDATLYIYIVTLHTKYTVASSE
jgi:hypothetical protein